MEPFDLIPVPPDKDDVIFRSDRDDFRRLDAHMDYMRGSDLPYSGGYLLAAQKLVRCVYDEGQQDFLVFSIVYLYRHHVELLLKRLIRLAADLAAEALTEQFEKHLGQHRIGQLWEDFKQLTGRDKFRASCALVLRPEDVAGIDSYIKQISHVDPDAQAFRYPLNTKGENSLPETLQSINIAVFSDHMDRLCAHLDGIDSYLDHLRELRNDMIAEAYDY